MSYCGETLAHLGLKSIRPKSRLSLSDVSVRGAMLCRSMDGERVGMLHGRGGEDIGAAAQVVLVRGDEDVVARRGRGAKATGVCEPGRSDLARRFPKWSGQFRLAPLVSTTPGVCALASALACDTGAACGTREPQTRHAGRALVSIPLRLGKEERAIGHGGRRETNEQARPNRYVARFVPGGRSGSQRN
ncbi:hypothetical protein BV20DRAFT_259251 [Pilatotrama ljubarskyi]|nr:hypothetical protein BV20DRAFT_259251 [Pilatotrama ljubarskyi]